MNFWRIEAQTAKDFEWFEHKYPGWYAEFGDFWKWHKRLSKKGETNILFNGDYVEELAAIAANLPDFVFIPALSNVSAADDWDGDTGLVHETVRRHLSAARFVGAIDAYACGPTPVINALLPVLQMNGVEPDHIFFDQFTPATR